MIQTNLTAKNSSIRLLTPIWLKYFDEGGCVNWEEIGVGTNHVSAVYEGRIGLDELRYRVGGCLALRLKGEHRFILCGTAFVWIGEDRFFSVLSVLDGCVFERLFSLSEIAEMRPYFGAYPDPDDYGGTVEGRTKTKGTKS